MLGLQRIFPFRCCDFLLHRGDCTDFSFWGGDAYWGVGVNGSPKGPRSNVQSLRQVLSGSPEFRVPRYQRAYSWAEAETGQLIEDLLEALDQGATYYFMGSIVLIRDREAEAEIVDGQQRLATFLMIIAALGARLAGLAVAEDLARLALQSHGPKPRLQLRPGDQSVFLIAVREPEEAQRLPVLNTEYSDSEMAILKAVRTIAEGLDDAALVPGRLEALAEFIVERAIFNVLETDDRAGAPRLFLVINDTGADLSAADLVKASLFERAQMNEAEAEEAARRWDALLSDMGRKGFDEMLAFMPSIVSGESTYYPSKFGLVRRGLLDHVDPVRFLEVDIHHYADALLAIRRSQVDAGEVSAEVNRRIRCMHLLKTRQWIGPAVAAVAEYEGAPERLLPFFEGLERLAYACTLSVVKSHKHSERFAEVLKHRREPTRLFGPGGALHLSPEMKSLMITRLNRPFADEVALRRTMTMRANSALPGGETLSLSDEASVEHILPNARSEWWARLFPDPVARRQLANMLGNFTLLTPPQNRAAGQLPYPNKRHIYFNWKGAPIRALTRTLRDFPDWTPLSVIGRHELVVDALARDWRLID